MLCGARSTHLDGAMGRVAISGSCSATVTPATAASLASRRSSSRTAAKALPMARRDGAGGLFRGAFDSISSRTESTWRSERRALRKRCTRLAMHDVRYGGEDNGRGDLCDDQAVQTLPIRRPRLPRSTDGDDPTSLAPTSTPGPLPQSCGSVERSRVPTVAGDPASSQNGQRLQPSAPAYPQSPSTTHSSPSGQGLRLAPPARAPSSKSCVSIRPRVAPSAVLTRISLSRVAVRVKHQGRRCRR